VAQVYRPDFGTDTPLIVRDRHDGVHEDSHTSDFIICRENLQIDAEELPHLNQTSSNLVQQQFRNKESQGSQKYKFVSSSSSFQKHKRSSVDKTRGKEHHSVMQSVSESLNNKLRLIPSVAVMVQPPQILFHGRKNSSTANLVALNRSSAETNLNQSCTAGSIARRQH